jgi:hypothetical protein
VHPADEHRQGSAYDAAMPGPGGEHDSMADAVAA